MTLLPETCCRLLSHAQPTLVPRPPFSAARLTLPHGCETVSPHTVMLLQQSARATSWSARFISARQSRKSTRPKTSCSTAQPLTHALPQRSRAALVTTGRPPYHSDDTAAPPPQGRMEAPPYVISRPSSLIHTKAAAAGSSSTGGGRRPGTATSTRPTSRVLLPAAGKTKGYAYAYKHHRTNNRSSTDINSACCCGVGEILCNHSNLPPAGAATCVPSFRLHHLSGGGRGGGGGIAAASSRAGISTAAAATQEAERASGGGSAVGGAVVRRGGEGGGDASSGDGASRLKSFRLTGETFGGERGRDSSLRLWGMLDLWVQSCRPRALRILFMPYKYDERSWLYY